MKTFETDSQDYPTEDTLKVIEEWDPKDFIGLMIYIKPYWKVRGAFSYDVDLVESILSTASVAVTVTISTHGWFGNERIIKAIEDNVHYHMMYWYESARGGHYVFEGPVAHER